MNKSVLLGIVAVALMSLPALAGEQKWEDGWPGHWVWDSQKVTKLNVKMVIPWYVEIVNQDPIWLEQVDCRALGRDPVADWPCFRGCKDLIVKCNFGCTLLAGVNTTYIGGMWGTSLNPADIDAPGGIANLCVKLWKADLTSKPANTEQHVADVEIWVKPR